MKKEQLIKKIEKDQKETADMLWESHGEMLKDHCTKESMVEYPASAFDTNSDAEEIQFELGYLLGLKESINTIKESV